MIRNKSQNPGKVSQPSRNRWVWIALFAVILFTSAIRIRLLSVPLERDEGEYAYAGQLILQGIPPYEKAYNMKMPGIYAAYALLLAVFGQTHTGIHLGLLFINAATIVLIFLLTKNLFDYTAAFFAATAFALLSVGQAILGFSANAEHFVLFPALAGILLVYKSVNSKKLLHLFIAGLLLGIAFLMKQHGVAFIMFAGIYLLVSLLKSKPVNWRFFLPAGAIYTAGVFIPFTMTCIILWRCGVFDKFWFWTFDYAAKYVSQVPLDIGLSIFKNAVIEITSLTTCLWVLAGAGLICLFGKKRFRHQSFFVTTFLFFSFLSICPGLYFRQHYFILLLPAVALPAGIAAASICEILAKFSSTNIRKIIPPALAVGIIFAAVYPQRAYLFSATPTDICRRTYGPNPFPESLEIARFIKDNSQKNDTVAIIGSEPQIYFYSERTSATGYVYTYPLMESHPYALQMQDEMISQIEQAGPKFIIFVQVYTSWLMGNNSEKKIFIWADQYIKQFYHLAGIVDIVSQDLTVISWGTEAAQYTPQSQNCVYILRHNRYGNPSNILPVNINQAATKEKPF